MGGENKKLVGHIAVTEVQKMVFETSTKVMSQKPLFSAGFWWWALLIFVPFFPYGFIFFDVSSVLALSFLLLFWKPNLCVLVVQFVLVCVIFSWRVSGSVGVARSATSPGPNPHFLFWFCVCFAFLSFLQKTNTAFPKQRILACLMSVCLAFSSAFVNTLADVLSLGIHICFSFLAFLYFLSVLVVFLCLLVFCLYLFFGLLEQCQHNIK